MLFKHLWTFWNSFFKDNTVIYQERVICHIQNFIVSCILEYKIPLLKVSLIFQSLFIFGSLYINQILIFHMWHMHFIKELGTSFSMWDIELVLGLKYKLPGAIERSGSNTALTVNMFFEWKGMCAPPWWEEKKKHVPYKVILFTWYENTSRKPKLDDLDEEYRV
jgi:hypothetical protein